MIRVRCIVYSKIDNRVHIEKLLFDKPHRHYLKGDFNESELLKIMTHYTEKGYAIKYISDSSTLWLIEAEKQL